MTNTMSTAATPTTAELLAGSPLAGPDGTEIAVPPVAAAVLLAAVAEDQHTYSLHTLPAAAQWHTEVEAHYGDTVIVAAGHVGLRYILGLDDTWEPDTITRLCEEPGCWGHAIGNRAATRVCPDHLGRPMRGVEDPHAAAQHRLSVLEAEIRVDEEQAAIQRNYCAQARSEPLASLNN